MTLYEFYQKYFLINLNDFHNIGIDLEISKVLFCFLVGLILTTIIINYRNNATATIVKKLLRHEVISSDAAKTLTELQINNLSTRMSLLSGGRISAIVKRADEKQYSYEEYSALIKAKGFKEEKINFEQARFYIHPDSLDDARKIAESPSPTLISTILFCILLLAIYVCIALLIPELLTLINNILE